jgi:hypothetical protein
MIASLWQWMLDPNLKKEEAAKMGFLRPGKDIKEEATAGMEILGTKCFWAMWKNKCQQNYYEHILGMSTH